MYPPQQHAIVKEHQKAKALQTNVMLKVKERYEHKCAEAENLKLARPGLQAKEAEKVSETSRFLLSLSFFVAFRDSHEIDQDEAGENINSSEGRGSRVRCCY